MERHELLVVVLWMIALYHILMGVGGILSEKVAEQLARDVFGLKLEMTPQTTYLVKLLGIYAAVFGGVVGLAATTPHRYPALLDLIVVLYALRFFNKVTCQRLQVEAFQATDQRIWTDAALLAAFGLSVFCLKP